MDFADLRLSLAQLQERYMDPDGLKVNYRALRQSSDWLELGKRFSLLSAFNPAELDAHQAKAFWINLYNLGVMFAAAQSSPPGSNLLAQWWFFSQKRFEIAGLRLSLDDLEHGILRENRKHPFGLGLPFGRNDPRLVWVLPLDSRIHFALNCSALSCPPIRAYDARFIDQQLEMATTSYLQAEVKVNQAHLELPMLLRWYANDFGGRPGIAALLQRHLGLDQALKLKWRYRRYNWLPNVWGS